MKGVEVHAVGVATPAVLTRELADGCADYVTSVVLQHDVVPRFSIHNVFEMKKEMDDTKWGDVLAERIKDWCVSMIGWRTTCVMEGLPFDVCVYVWFCVVVCFVHVELSSLSPTESQLKQTQTQTNAQKRMVPDAIERSATYQKLAGRASRRADAAFKWVVNKTVNGALGAASAVVGAFQAVGCCRRP